MHFGESQHMALNPLIILKFSSQLLYPLEKLNIININECSAFKNNDLQHRPANHTVEAVCSFICFWNQCDIPASTLIKQMCLNLKRKKILLWKRNRTVRPVTTQWKVWLWLHRNIDESVHSWALVNTKLLASSQLCWAAALCQCVQIHSQCLCA